ncbi:WxL domain-containing protein [Pseudarthrobacter sp. NPDC080039]|uniref:WxL domain-containing protein n=1 Tax=unclassified Pseudarthrobacter TaxID=2647000 RepID=UPI00344BA057
MRKISKVSALIAVVGISLAAGLAPASADTVNSTVSGASLSATTAAPALSAVTLNGTSTQTSTGTSTQWSLTDARGTGAAWTLSASATDFTSAAGTVETAVRTITAPNLTITPGTVTAAAGADPATGITAPALVMSTTSQALVSAPVTHKGTYDLTPSFSLAIPANAYRSNYSGAVGSTALNPYTSTITYTIA